MNLLQELWGSSLGRKYVMAVTGACLFLFAVGHMVGNLQVFLGAEPLNAYAHLLQSSPKLLWCARLTLLVIVILHVGSAVALTLENRAARPVAYVQARYEGSSLASRTMLLSGLILGCFVVFHLLHYTVRMPAVNLTGKDFADFQHTLADGTVCPDVYRMMIVGFSHRLVALFYAVGVTLLCFHLGHGVGAMFQSLGLKNRVWGSVVDRAAWVAAGVLWLGYLSIPVAVQLGLGKEVLP
ncbi:MAG: succinate dehydrogenase cytochrome b subunit [Verrucomicrobia bacterium]|nr:succinate dehydrogenase cytochrome b subunit [Verrucomicrobiota bacterium]